MKKNTGFFLAVLAGLAMISTTAPASTDRDGVLEAEDKCSESILTDTVIIEGCEECDSGVRNVVFKDGCTMSDLIAQCSGGEKDHGNFVSCVADLTNEWKSAGFISGAEKGAIQSCAAKSNKCKDDNCDGLIDTIDTFYRDADNDTFGNPSVTMLACSQPAGYVTNSDDCDDTVSGLGLITWYWDYDGDGYGRDSGAYCTTPIRACSKPEMNGFNFSQLNTDCKDNDPARHPGATETCNGIDDDCDGQTDEGVQATYYRDADSDSYGNASVTTQACTLPAGYVTSSTDCNDSTAAVNPGATEVCNGIDDDCDGQTDESACSTTSIPPPTSDADNDGIPDSEDNCPDKPNGPALGTCTPSSDKAGEPCTSDAGCVIGCSTNGTCSMDQADTDADGKGDVCDK